MAALAALAALATPPAASDPSGPPLPGERFTFVFLPCGETRRVTERSLLVGGVGLDQDLLGKALRGARSEIGPAVDITALSAPSPSTGQVLAVSLYTDGNDGAEAKEVRPFYLRCRIGCYRAVL
jgi:hypothetical protein